MNHLTGRQPSRVEPLESRLLLSGDDGDDGDDGSSGDSGGWYDWYDDDGGWDDSGSTDSGGGSSDGSQDGSSGDSSGDSSGSSWGDPFGDSSGNPFGDSSGDSSDDWGYFDEPEPYVPPTPQAVDDHAAAVEDGPAVFVNALSNDLPAYEGDCLRIAAFGRPAHGHAVLGDDGETFAYTPAPDYNGGDGFWYTIVDPDGLTSDGWVGVWVTPVNDAPSASGAAFAVDQDSPLVFTLPASDLETARAGLRFNVPARSDHGTLTRLGQGRYRYTPDAGFTGPDTFNFSVTDNGDVPRSHAGGGDLTSAPAGVTIDVRSLDLGIGPWIRLAAGGRARYTDANGDTVTVSLSGRDGAACIYFVDHAPRRDAELIVMSGTTSASRLTMSVARGAGGDGRTTVGGFRSGDSVGAINAAKADLSGDVWVGGSLGTLTLGNLPAGPHAIETRAAGVGEAGTQLTLSLGAVADTSVDTHGQPIRSLKAIRWIDTDDQADRIHAPRIGVLATTGAAREKALTGNFDADLLLDGAATRGQGLLGRADVRGDLGARQWSLAGGMGPLTVWRRAGRDGGERFTLRADGGTAAMTFGAVRGADVWAGLPIRSIRVTGWRGAGAGVFVSSARFEAPVIGSASLTRSDVAGDWVLAGLRGAVRRIG